MDILVQSLKTGLKQLSCMLKGKDSTFRNKEEEEAYYVSVRLLKLVDEYITNKDMCKVSRVLVFGDRCPQSRHKAGLSCHACSSCIEVKPEINRVICNEK